MAQQNNSRIRQQRRQRLIIVMMLLVLVAVAAFFILSPNSKRPQQQEQRPTGMIAIPVAKKDIPLGTRISSLMFRISYMKPSEVPVDAIISPKEFMGRFTRRTILASEYFREIDITEPGGHSGFSGIAKPGMRIVHMNAELFPGSLNTLRVGDKIDLLSIEYPGGQASGGESGANIRALQKSASTAWGGENPGDAKARAVAKRALNEAKTGGVASTSNAVIATLIAENAEIMFVPKKNQPRGRPNNNGDFVVFQMTPEDAHVSVLAASIGKTMRVVFRPFSDDTRLTPVKEVQVTTRLPKPSKDPETITIITGLQRRQQKPMSETYRTDSENSQRFSPNEDKLLIKGNNQQEANVVESPNFNLYDEY